MSSLTSGQAKFASVFARETGLNPQVVGAWELAEQSGSAAQGYQARGYHNWLNIANTDSGPAGGAHSNVWRNPESAAKASAEWIRGRGQIAQEYGRPASGITAILNSHAQVPARQVQAIARSGWASSGYHGGTDLMQLLGQVGNVPTEKGQPGSPLPQATRQGAIEQTTGRFNNQGYQEATQHAAGERAAAGLFTGAGAGDAALREALNRAGQPPNPKTFAGVERPIVQSSNGVWGGSPPTQAQHEGAVSAIETEMNHIAGAHVPYLWGGGHQGRVLPGAKVTPLDCSGAVSAALGINPKVASEFENWGKPGKGAHMTIWASSGHVLMEVHGHFWGTSGANPGGGAGWIPAGNITPEYLKSFVPRHPANEG